MSVNENQNTSDGRLEKGGEDADSVDVCMKCQHVKSRQWKLHRICGHENFDPKMRRQRANRFCPCKCEFPESRENDIVVPCSHCAGEGWVVLTGVCADTLALLTKQKKEISGAELARIAKVNPTAMNNRLVALEGYGLATGRRYGAVRLWKAQEATQ